MKLVCRITAMIVIGWALAFASAGLADEPKPTATPAAKATPSPKSLGDVAKGLVLKPQDGKSSGIVISNETLPEYATKGRITTANPSAVAAMKPDDSEPSDSKRDYWRNMYIEQLKVIADLEEEIASLDLQIPKLWSDYYARDDPAYRDGVIKPKLDDALVRRDKLEKELAEEQQKPAEIKSDARKDGAEPGWFRGL